MVEAETPDETSSLGTNQVSRRQIVRLGSGAALALVIGGGTAWLDRARNQTSNPNPATNTSTSSTTTTLPTTTTTAIEIDGIANIDPRIIKIGQRVVEVTGEGDINKLFAQLAIADANLSGDPSSDDVGADPLTRASNHIRTEFLAGDTITVDGWLLAASEARAAAIIALYAQGSASVEPTPSNSNAN